MHRFVGVTPKKVEVKMGFPSLYQMMKNYLGARSEWVEKGQPKRSLEKIQELHSYITGEPPLTGIGSQVTVAADAEKQALDGYSTDKNKPEYVADSKPVEVFNDETSEG